MPTPPNHHTGTYGTSARRGPGGCGRAARPVAIAHAHEDPALRPARPCAAPHRVPCGAPGGVPPQPPHRHARHAGPTCTRRARAGRPYGPLHPHSRTGHRVRLRVKSSPCCWLINDPSHQNLRHLRAAPRGGLERAAAGPPGSRTTRRRSPPAPSVHTWPLSASRRRRPRARPPSPHGPHPGAPSAARVGQGAREHS